ncbi:AIPR family protein [Ligilactobacillus salivarius]|uniref:AIPR family protein n=1 Tax=Ligilactobacillus salivarius TaxID=1624 RepID=UPI001F511FBD|nr:AIPR family protein [Ligilactobacillus salivarius]
MEELKFKFPIVSHRAMSVPSMEGVKTDYVYVKFEDLPKNMPTDVNARKPNMKTNVANTLKNAVNSDDDGFEVNNRGIVLIAKNINYKIIKTKEGKQSILDLNFGEEYEYKGDPDTVKYGILDGGHTYEAITKFWDKEKYKEEGNEYKEKYVKLEIFTGDALTAAIVSNARNTSVQVSETSILNLENKFDIIKNAIAKETYANDIAYKDNDVQRVGVTELIRLMYIFNIRKFKDNQQAPTGAYVGKRPVFKDYADNYGKKDNIYKKLSLKLPDFIELYEKIQEEMPAKYIEYKKMQGVGASFGKLRGVTSYPIEQTGEKRKKKNLTSKQKEKYATLYTQHPLEYVISNGYIFPILSAFRVLLYEKKDGTLEWRKNPIKMWEQVGTRLVQRTFDTDTNPNQLGKNRVAWQNNYGLVTEELQKMILADNGITL